MCVYGTCLFLCITDSALALMESYIDGRKQCVQIEGVILGIF